MKRRKKMHARSPSPQASSVATTVRTEPNSAEPPPANRIWLPALASGILLWAAFPPLGWWPLAWLAPIGWCQLVQQDRRDTPASSRAFYLRIYLAGFLHWLLVLQWVRLPHWSTYFGWPALCLYLAIYWPLFVALSRRIVHQGKWPLMVVCPVVWCGLECVRSRFLTGFAMGLLGHTQIDFPAAIQIADIGGGYAVGFILVLFAAACTETWHRATPSNRRFTRLQTALPVIIGSLISGASILYGCWRLQTFNLVEPSVQATKIALIQGSRDTTFSLSDNPQDTLDEYRRLTTTAVEQHPEIDLIVWPESMHTVPWFDFQTPVSMPEDFPGSLEELHGHLAYGRQLAQYEAGWFARQFGKSALVGCSAVEFGPGFERQTNRGLWLDPSGNHVGHYDKMHPVMFGEYVPLANLFPILQHLTPIGKGLAPGESPLAVAINDIILSPCICYENTVPHLMRQQVRTLIRDGNSPDAMVTITNDGWFWGSSALDMHLACGIFRAVELRRPMLIAANTGFSAEIDAGGIVRQQGPRRSTGYLIADVYPRRDGESFYLAWGDAWSFACWGVYLFAALRHRRGAT